MTEWCPHGWALLQPQRISLCPECPQVGTPIHDGLVHQWWLVPVLDMGAPTENELGQHHINWPNGKVLRWLWCNPSRPVCGAVHPPPWHHVCLLPADFHHTQHWAPTETGGGAVWVPTLGERHAP